MSIMFLILFTIFICILIYELIKNKNRFYVGTQIPGPWFIPFIGNLQLISMKPESVFKTIDKYRQQYRATFRLWLGPNLWIFLHSPEEAKQALNHPELHRAEDFQMLRPLIGNGLLISEGAQWSHRRRALMPAFHPKILEGFIVTISQHADTLMNILKNHQKCEISNYFFNCILDTICETSMGAEINSQQNPNCTYANAFHMTMRLLFERMINPLLTIDCIYEHTKSYEKLKSSIQIIHQLTDSVIEKRRQCHLQQQQQSNVATDTTGSNATMTNGDSNEHKNINDDNELGIKKRSVLLDILLNNYENSTLTINEIKDEVNTFLFAGVDTTKSAMSFIAYNLAKYQNLQHQIREEIQTNNIPDNHLTMENIKELKLLDQFIKESQRIYTTVPFTGRRTITPLTKIGTLELPKDVTVWINMHGLAHDPTIFTNPYEFRIDRFNTNNDQTILPYTFLPFSAGPHICIGKRYAELILRVLTIKLLLKFEITLQNPDEELDLISEMVLKSRTGINLILKEL